MAAILRYLTLWHDDILAAFPAGKVPPVEEVTLRTAADMEPYLREPLSPGWKSVYGCRGSARGRKCDGRRTMRGVRRQGAGISGRWSGLVAGG